MATTWQLKTERGQCALAKTESTIARPVGRARAVYTGRDPGAEDAESTQGGGWERRSPDEGSRGKSARRMGMSHVIFAPIVFTTRQPSNSVPNVIAPRQDNTRGT